jgi:hypothetical protein
MAGEGDQAPPGERLRAAGLVVRKFVGAAALDTMVAANWARYALVPPRPSPIAATIRSSACACAR